MSVQLLLWLLIGRHIELSARAATATSITAIPAHCALTAGSASRPVVFAGWNSFDHWVAAGATATAATAVAVGPAHLTNVGVHGFTVGPGCDGSATSSRRTLPGEVAHLEALETLHVLLLLTSAIFTPVDKIGVESCDKNKSNTLLRISYSGNQIIWIWIGLKIWPTRIRIIPGHKNLQKSSVVDPDPHGFSKT